MQARLFLFQHSWHGCATSHTTCACAFREGALTNFELCESATCLQEDAKSNVSRLQSDGILNDKNFLCDNRKPKNQRVKRALDDRAPKLVENEKTAMFIRGGRTSETVTQVLKDLVSTVTKKCASIMILSSFTSMHLRNQKQFCSKGNLVLLITGVYPFSLHIEHSTPSMLCTERM